MLDISIDSKLLLRTLNNYSYLSHKCFQQFYLDTLEEEIYLFLPCELFLFLFF